MIDLQVANIDFDILTPGLTFIENVAKSSWNQSTIFVAARASSHSKSFTRPSLPIGKYCSIKSFQSGIYHIFRYFIEHLFLFCIHIEDLIKLERPFLFFVIDVPLLLFFGDEKLSPILLFVDGFVTKKVLNPLKVFLLGRTLRMI